MLEAARSERRVDGVARETPAQQLRAQGGGRRLEGVEQVVRARHVDSSTVLRWDIGGGRGEKLYCACINGCGETERIEDGRGGGGGRRGFRYLEAPLVEPQRCEHAGRHGAVVVPNSIGRGAVAAPARIHAKGGLGKVAAHAKHVCGVGGGGGV